LHLSGLTRWDFFELQIRQIIPYDESQVRDELYVGLLFEVSRDIIILNLLIYNTKYIIIVTNFAVESWYFPLKKARRNSTVCKMTASSNDLPFSPSRTFPRDVAINVTARRTCARNLIRVLILSACERIIIATYASLDENDLINNLYGKRHCLMKIIRK